MDIGMAHIDKFKILLDGKPDILAVFEREGAILQQKGKNFWTTCLLHSEKTASCKIDPDRQTFYCFGCHEHGDVITLIKKLHSLSFKETLSYLGISNTAQKFRPKTSNKKQRLLKAFRQWEKEKRDELALPLRGIRRVMVGGFQDMDEAGEYAELFHALPVLEYHHEILCGRDDAQKYELFLEEAKNATCGHF